MNINPETAPVTVLSDAAYDKVVDLSEQPAEPTPALKALMKKHLDRSKKEGDNAPSI